MKIHSSAIAPMVVFAFLGTILIGSAWELPSMQMQFSDASDQVRTVNLIVEGLRCRGTSNFFIEIVGNVPGVTSVTTYVQEHRATIEYDPSRIDAQGIVRAVENPVTLSDGSRLAPFHVLEIAE